MDDSSVGTASSIHLVPGTRAVLMTGGRRFLVALLSVQGDVLRVSFPMRDFPVEGMPAVLEFHEERGFAAYDCEVIATPREVGDGLRIRLMRSEGAESRHRGAWRVDTSIPLTIKGHVHPRRHEGTAVNISAHGMRLTTQAFMEVGDNFDFSMALGEGKQHKGVGQVMHAAPTSAPDEARQYGVRFIGADPALTGAISRYVWRQVRLTHGLEQRPPEEGG